MSNDLREVVAQSGKGHMEMSKFKSIIPMRKIHKWKNKWVHNWEADLKGPTSRVVSHMGATH